MNPMSNSNTKPYYMLHELIERFGPDHVTIDLSAHPFVIMINGQPGPRFSNLNAAADTANELYTNLRAKIRAGDNDDEDTLDIRIINTAKGITFKRWQGIKGWEWITTGAAVQDRSKA